MRAIILAAGKGSRMRPLTLEKPKGLLKIGDETIVGRQIRQLKDLGINESNISIVIGHMANKFRDYFNNTNLKFIENEDYAITDNLYSFLLTEEFGKNTDLIVTNGDAIFGKELLKKTINSNGSCYPVDLNQKDEESLKVKIKENRVIKILDKDSQKYDGLTTEIFKISKKDTELLYKTANQMSKKNLNQWFDQAIDKILSERYFKVVDVSDCYWEEVDTQEELKQVRRNID